MNFGRADRLLIIYKTTNATNEGGEFNDRYAPFCKAWAERFYMSGGETVQADQTVGIRNTVYEIRFVEGIDQYMVIQDEIDNTKWNISSVEEIGRRDKIRLTCFKRDNQ